MAQTVKCLSAMQETRVQSLGWEDPLEKEMAAHSSTLAWRIPGTAEPGRLPSMGSQRVGDDGATSLSFFLLIAPRREGHPWQREEHLSGGWWREEALFPERVWFSHSSGWLEFCLEVEFWEGQPVFRADKLAQHCA